jgi:adenylate kinase family enzyme
MGIPGSALRKVDSPQRIAIVGPPGCGKSTLARKLAGQTGLPYVELDSLYYKPMWQKTPDQAFYDAVVRHAGEDAWIIDGNYEVVRDIVWVRAQQLVWLDFPLYLVLWRLLARTTRRLLSGEMFANGNRESFWRLFGTRSIFLWAIRFHGPRRRKFEELLGGRRYAHLRVLRFRSQGEADAWFRRTQ